ncbi:hypothetical protein A5893_15580 [Pedobacter psychrophilus]|uniref:DUF1573 domain-containing protein n=1 Tax=Pedobacter psychrophilus TaxID=1826909 RepID=A0A179DAZ0_9SPHI|nr:DUF1573 domain-containing protein [Pedobacter psychrophilus]OAQ38216.1 hypothetical protein A5893_15580 [Pedobacter psychrophilus]
MKNIILIITFFTILSQQFPTLEFDKKIYDFKKIKPNTTVTATFKLTNKSNKVPLIIYSVSTTCGCTTAKAPKIIKPSQSDFIIIKFDSRGYNGLINKDIVVITNTKNEYDKLTIKGNVSN